MVINWLFDDRPNPLADRYRKLFGPQPVLLAFQTVMERCQLIGHALGGKLHDGDWWIAATAIRLAVPLVSHDGLFKGCPWAWADHRRRRWIAPPGGVARWTFWRVQTITEPSLPVPRADELKGAVGIVEFGELEVACSRLITLVGAATVTL